MHSHSASEQKSSPKPEPVCFTPLFLLPVGKRIFNAAAPSPQRCARDDRQGQAPRGRRGDCPGLTRAAAGRLGRGLRPLPSPHSRPARAAAPGRGSRPPRPIKGGRGPGGVRCGAEPGCCLWTAAGPGHAGSSRTKPDSPSSRCHGLRPVRRLPPGQEPVLQELNSESSVSSSSSCCLDAVNITDQDKALHGLPELIDKHWWIKSFFHSEPSPPTVGRKTLSASSTNS
ncbi:pancreatic progenitor cell differentiation and proliferation factor-like protein isoform X1 [Motacilla alba alba]|uniref:pancreatic progenitor cell differentiation and proliferation factor-like protein isoform X1 n=1 Tax=Motacilla alba alba TaxID=1094192 RepID=UPI0018D59F97|nr:pancreatic progenitor cell differentiation and proliferation factor-like protein isoform X1 [Motacilla alba alba]